MNQTIPRRRSSSAPPGIAALLAVAAACGDESGAPEPSSLCAAGLYLDAAGDNVVLCFDRETRTIPLLDDARALTAEALAAAGVADPGPLSTFVVPSTVVPGLDAAALYKPREATAEREALIQLLEGLSAAEDDGVLVLALLHELGHVAQFRSGQPAGDQLEAVLCTRNGLEGERCQARIVEHIREQELGADAYMLSVIEQWSVGGRAGQLDFDPYSMIDVFANNPPSPTYPPPAERAETLRSALTTAGVPRRPAGTPPTRRRLDQLPVLAAQVQAALDAQGALPP